MKLKAILGTASPIIGVVHLSPLIGYPQHRGYQQVLQKALQDLRALDEGGLDGIIVENNYDLPHTIKVGAHTVSMMTLLAKEIVNNTTLPVGICVLWNDYQAALAIAKSVSAKFVRVPVFVDSVLTDFGEIAADAKAVLAYRLSIGAEDIAIFTDIQVKHARMLNPRAIGISALEAIQDGSDAIIVTGRWTADAPGLDKLQAVRKAIGRFPLLAGSGVDANNIRSILDIADGAIVSTSLKSGINRPNERNIKPADEQIDLQKVRQLMMTVKGIR